MARQIETCDFVYTAARARKMDEAALAYTIRDCYEAALAADSLDAAGLPNNSGKYWDEYHTYTAERARRIKQAGSKAAAVAADRAAAAELVYERANA